MTVILQIQNVSKQFDGLAALSDVSFDVHQGELLALVGPNGAGKSTLFNAIAGVFAPTQGHILLDGQDITGLPSHELARRGLARTFQMVNLFSELTALENVMQGFHRHMPTDLWGGLFQTAAYRQQQADWQARAMDVLRNLDLHSMADVPAHALPLGQAKLLTVAIAMATQPKLLLLDEPAAGLDLGGREDLLRRFAHFAADPLAPATILVTHHIEEIPTGTTHALLIKDGSIAVSGPIDQVITSEHVSAVFGTAISVTPESGRYFARATV